MANPFRKTAHIDKPYAVFGALLAVVFLLGMAA